MSEMRDEELSGKMIVTQDGRDLGEVAGLIVDVARWRVTGLKVKVRRDRLDDLRLKRPLIGSASIDLPIDQVQAVSDRVVLRAPLDELIFTGGDRTDEQQPPPSADAASPKPAEDGEDQIRISAKDLLGDD